jgi:GH25 family lysozyme M1 (1,4-beta-N-acetylmuramidase)
MTIYYPDVSQFTPGASLADTVAVCARASEGDWLYDSTYAWYKNEAATQKCPFFAYHVIEAGNAAAQARWCHNRVGSIPLMMDIEKAGSSTPKIGDVTGFIDAYRALGGLTWLAYLPKWYWQSIGSPSLAPVAQRGCHLVSSDYTTYSDSGPGWAGYGGMAVSVWQYTDTMNQHGKHVDGNAFKGTQAELVNLFRTGNIAGAAAQNTHPTIAQGATGAPVTLAQQRLNTWGAAPKLTVDGDFGAKTKTAAEAFQRLPARKLTVDGVIGPATWAALLKNP